ncbi:MAG: CotH kinase family protein [Rikenellaceae bacterium]
MRRLKILIVVLIVCCASAVIARSYDSFIDTTKSHSDKYAPNYEEVFDRGETVQKSVKKIELKISSAHWKKMWDNLDETFSDLVPFERPEGDIPEMGQPPFDGEMMPPEMGMLPPQGELPPPGGMMPPNRQIPNNMGGEMPDSMMMHGDRMPFGGEFPQGMQGGNMIDPLSSISASPIWIPCTLIYDGKEWEQVGLRFKGNSSLMRTYLEGGEKMSMKLDFDRYEDEFPELKNQRFYGFKQLNLNNNYNDASFMREKVVSDLLREFGLVASHTSFCELYIDYGEGLKYFGLYTIVEEVDDTVLGDQFSDDSGNLYKPEEKAGSFAEGTFNTEEFHLKSKTNDNVYKDVKTLYEVLNSSQRTLDELAWCSDLEKIFDVDAFLKWLAVNITIQNWDTYGNMAHNYFLYNNPQNSKLTWISWDHNEALLQDGRNIYEPSTLINAGESWPLITYLIGVEDYQNRFNEYLKEFVNDVFETEKVTELYDTYYELLKESVDVSQNLNSIGRAPLNFEDAVNVLKEHVKVRNETLLEN